jgi:hypothetical protein
MKPGKTRRAMFKRRTLFVVGAGASKEFGLPLGPELAATIAGKVNITARDWGHDVQTGDVDIASQLHRRDHKRLSNFTSACHTIRDGVQMASSIDDFLDAHASNEDVKIVGKIAIAKSILEEERKSKLFFDKSNFYNKMKVNKFEGTWLIKFIRMLGRGVPKERIDTIFHNAAFIVFNYDRCIEQCLYHALQQLYAVPAPQAAEILSKLTIIHPYGAVGHLKTESTPSGVAFGGEHDRLSENYAMLSDRIKTYTEQVDDEQDLAVIHDEVRKAERLVFLGFAFHDQNVALIKPNGPLARKDIYATAFGMSSSDVQVIEAQLLNFFDGIEREIMQNGRIVIRNDLKCTDLFDQYTRSLPN